MEAVKRLDERPGDADSIRALAQALVDDASRDPQAAAQLRRWVAGAQRTLSQNERVVEHASTATFRSNVIQAPRHPRQHHLLNPRRSDVAEPLRYAGGGPQDGGTACGPMRILHGGALLASAAALLFSAACGSSGGKASATPSASAARSGGVAAYVACLRQHGVTIPTARPSGRPSGQAGGGFFGGGANQQALHACRSLMPNRGSGFGGRGMQEMQAYRRCLSDHGVKLPSRGVRSPGAQPSPGARRTPGGGPFGDFDTANPKVAKAVKTCRPLLPTFAPRPSPS